MSHENDTHRSVTKVKSPQKLALLSSLSPKKRREHVVVQQGVDALEVWWTPPEHVRVKDVAALTKKRFVGSVTGIFDSSYADDVELSVQQKRALVLYEVELADMDDELRSVFGFRARDDVRFEVPAEKIWSLPAGRALATAYELYYYTEQHSATIGPGGLPAAISQI